MRFDIKFEVDHLDRALAAVRRGLEQPEPLLGSIGESLLNVNRERHDAGLAPDGSKWKPLSPMTLANDVGTRKGILAKNGRMLQSFKHKVSGNDLTLGFDGATESQRAAWHNSGTDPYVITPKKAKALKFGGMYRKRVNHPGLPKRQLVGLPDSDRRLIVDVADNYLRVILNRIR
ncbi:MAG: phage virion morphogenesis protein [Gallionella sp.]